MKRYLWACLASTALASGLYADDAPAEPDAIFNQLDANGDGIVTSDEVSEEQARYFNRLLRRGDADANGELTKEEFIAGLEEDERPVAQPGGSAPGRGGVTDGQRLQITPEILTRIDAAGNGDGKVTLEEIPEEIRPRFATFFERLGIEEIEIARLGELARRQQQMLAERSDNPPGSDRPQGEDAPREGDRPEGDRPRDGDVPRVGDRPDGERPREGDQPREGGDRPRDGDAPRDGNRPEGGQPREGDAPREGDRPIGGGFQGPQFFRLLDENNDRQLSRGELENIGEVFDELDRNDDGQLDMMELMGGPGRPQGGGFPGGAPGTGFPGGGFPGGDRPRPEGGRPPLEDDQSREQPREGDRPPMDGDQSREEPRDGDRPRDDEGDRSREEGDRPRDVPREEDGDRSRDEGERPREERDDDRSREAGDRPREGDAPRPDGERPMPPGGRGQFNPEQLFNNLDADGDGFVSETELPERMRPIMTQADTNRDGKLSSEELFGFMRRQREQQPDGGTRPDGDRPMSPEQGFNTMFSSVDRNGDGFITVDEVPERFGEGLFERADADGDGKLSRDEMLADMRRGRAGRGDGGAPPEGFNLEGIFARADRNGDGFLTADEMPEGRGQEMLSEGDTNDDGKLSSDEFRVFLTTRAGGRGPRPDGERPDRESSDEGSSREEDVSGEDDEPQTERESVSEDDEELSINDRFFNLLDANGDGYVTADEVSDEMPINIDDADLTGDGRLSSREVSHFMERAFGQLYSGPRPMPADEAREWAEEQFARGDDNGDGFITAIEMLDERAAESFLRIDADEDGRMSREEYVRFASATLQRGNLPGHPDPDAYFAELFSRSDDNSDGFLTDEELGPNPEEYLAEWDADGDDKISLLEHRAMMYERRGLRMVSQE